MEITFYTAAVIAVACTARVITCSHAVHALLYLIVSLIAVAVVFYALGAPFAAALEVIIYAGAIMVLFVFVVMMLNLGRETLERERRWRAPRTWIVPGTLALALLLVVLISLARGGGLGNISGEPLQAHDVGALMFSQYVLVIELAAFVLLAALVVAAHVGREDPKSDRALSGRVHQTTKK